MSNYPNMDKLANSFLAATITVTTSVATIFPSAAVTVTFQEFTPPGGVSQFNLVRNEYNAQNIQLENFYRYVDSGDTNDSIGISLGPIELPNSENAGDPQTGIIDFLTPVNNLTFEYWTINGELDIQALDANNNVLDTLLNLEGPNTIVSVNGNNIAELQVNGLIGLSQITTLNFTPVPESASSLGLLAFGTFGVGLRLLHKQKKKKSSQV